MVECYPSGRERRTPRPQRAADSGPGFRGAPSGDRRDASSLNQPNTDRRAHTFNGAHSSRRRHAFAPVRPHARRRRSWPPRSHSRRGAGTGPSLRRLQPCRLALPWRAVREGIEGRADPGARRERYKQLPTVSRVYEALIRANADRASTVITFGGGVIGDMAGFAAASYLRGVALVHVPTTLLAQVDSSIGGKVGVNHALGKNLIGAFYQPHAVVIDPSLLGTLPRREFRAGLYEVIKYGMTSSPALLERVARERKAIFARTPDVLTAVIGESCRIKAEVVAQDEKESGLRRILNFGHTAGHALESVTKYRRYRHGEAVAYGMLVAAALAVGRDALAERDRQALADVIVSLGPLPPVTDVSSAEILGAMRHDKKMVAGRLNFVLPTGIGATTIVDDVTEKEMNKALAQVGFHR
ncbi:MAG: 3-dehydroquinate synthase [Luteitalea sp.]|nr:3-dehydroquinate synthase [Luteitalea sp.]